MSPFVVTLIARRRIKERAQAAATPRAGCALRDERRVEYGIAEIEEMLLGRGQRAPSGRITRTDIWRVANGRGNIERRCGWCCQRCDDRYQCRRRAREINRLSAVSVLRWSLHLRWEHS